MKKRVLFMWVALAGVSFILFFLCFVYLSQFVSPFRFSMIGVDRLELSLLQANIPEDSSILDVEKSFPIRGYGTSRTPVLRQVILTGPEMESVKKEFLEATTPGTLQYLCHAPIYGFRFYRGTKLVAETSVCFSCRNFYAKSLGKYGWVALSPSSDNLERLLNQILPAVQADK